MVSTLVVIYFDRTQLGHTTKTNCVTSQTYDLEKRSISIFYKRVLDELLHHVFCTTFQEISISTFQFLFFGRWKSNFNFNLAIPVLFPNETICRSKQIRLWMSIHRLTQVKVVVSDAMFPWLISPCKKSSISMHSFQRYLWSKDLVISLDGDIFA